MSVEDRVLRLENAFATLVEIQRGLEERFDTHETWINELGRHQAELTATQAELTVTQAELTAAQAELTAAQAELTAAQAELTKAQARTEATLVETNERLNNLINVVERFISERNKGES
jgi:septal ring factor EnvC (AmiA/AmiB activator)